MTQTTLPTVAAVETDARNSSFRRTAAGLGLIVGPLLLVAANVASTQADSDTAAGLTTLAHHGGREQLSIVLFLLGFTLIIPGAFGMLSLIRNRGRIVGNIGICLAIPGLMAFAGLVSSGIANVGIARAVPPSQGLIIMKSVEAGGGAAALGVIGLLALPLGLILLSFGVWRARRVPIWSPLLVLVGFVAVTVGEGLIGGVVGDLLMLAGLGWAGLAILRSAD